MWYWLRKFEGMLVIPGFIAYYAVRHIPFTTKCRKCRRWLTDQQFLRAGICWKCSREMILSKPHEFYNQGAAIKFPCVALGQEHLYRKITKLLCKVRDGRLLDVGCGYGNLLSRLPWRAASDLYGVDISRDAIATAKNRDGNFCLGDAKNLPFSSNSFDYLICTELLEHIEGADAMREYYRVLKPNGVALITVPNGMGVGGRYFPEHIHLFTFKTITACLREAGFEIICSQKFGLYVPFVSRSLEILSAALGRNLPMSPVLNIEVPEFLAASFLVECRKPPI